MRTAAWCACLCLASLAQAGDLSQEVVEAADLDQLSEEGRKVVLSIARRPTFDLTMGPRTMRGDTRIFEYLMDNLEICATAGRALGVDNYHTRRDKDGRIFGDDGGKATGYLTFLRTRPGKRVFFVEGTQKGFFTVGGHSLVALDFAPGKQDSGWIEYKLRVWVRVDSAFFAFLSKVFLGKSRSTADRQFSRMLGVPVGVTQRIDADPRAVLDSFQKTSEEEKAALARLTALVQEEMRSRPVITASESTPPRPAGPWR